MRSLQARRSSSSCSLFVVFVVVVMVAVAVVVEPTSYRKNRRIHGILLRRYVSIPITKKHQRPRAKFRMKQALAFWDRSIGPNQLRDAKDFLGPETKSQKPHSLSEQNSPKL